MTRCAWGFVAATAIALAACSGPGGGSFQSDRITVVVQGDGPDIVLIPGLTSDRNVWDSVAPRLGQFRLHLVQVNGFAGTAPGPNAEGPVAAPVAEEIARYLAEVHLTGPAVIGHSMGGTIAMLLAARHPELVGRLMVVDMPPFLGAMFGPPERAQPIADSLSAQMAAAPPDSFVATFGQSIASMTGRAERRAGLLQNVRTSDQGTVVHAFHELIVTDLGPELARITAPFVVLYVVPPNLPFTPAQFDTMMAGAFANAKGVRLVRIPDSYHFIQFDQPDRLVAEVQALMR